MFPIALGSKRIDRPAISDVEKKTGQKAIAANGVDKTHWTSTLYPIFLSNVNSSHILRFREISIYRENQRRALRITRIVTAIICENIYIFLSRYLDKAIHISVKHCNNSSVDYRSFDSFRVVKLTKKQAS